MFRGGLRHLPQFNEKLIYGTRDTPLCYHDKMDYDRGIVTHSRSPSNQHLNFHFLYGGFRTYFWDRWFMNHWYRRNLRNWWLPVLLWYTCNFIPLRSRLLHHAPVRQRRPRLLLLLRLRAEVYESIR